MPAIVQLPYGREAIRLDDGALLAVPPMRDDIPRQARTEVLLLVLRRQYGEAYDTAAAWNRKLEGAYSRDVNTARMMAQRPLKFLPKRDLTDDERTALSLSRRGYAAHLLREIRAGNLPAAVNTVRDDFLAEDARDYPDGLFGTAAIPSPAPRLTVVPAIDDQPAYTCGTIAGYEAGCDCSDCMDVYADAMASQTIERPRPAWAPQPKHRGPKTNRTRRETNAARKARRYAARVLIGGRLVAVDLEDGAEHGTSSVYTGYGCRCARCCAAQARYHAERNRSDDADQPSLLDVA